MILKNKSTVAKHPPVDVKGAERERRVPFIKKIYSLEKIKNETERVCVENLIIESVINNLCCKK